MCKMRGSGVCVSTYEESGGQLIRGDEEEAEGGQKAPT